MTKTTAQRKLDEIHAILDKGKEQPSMLFVIDIVTWIMRDRIEQLKQVINVD